MRRRIWYVMRNCRRYYVSGCLWLAAAAVLLTGCGKNGRADDGGRLLAEESFCQQAPLPSYLAATKQMQPVRLPPRSQRLSFGPPTVTFGTFGSQVLPIGRYPVPAGPFGYVLALTKDAEEQVKLGWRIETGLGRIDLDGNVIRELQKMRYEVPELRPSQRIPFGIETPLSAGFYRFSITIDSGIAARQPITFSEFVRVVRPRFAARLRLERRRFRAGDAVLVQLVNHGTTVIGHGLGVGTERFSKGRWVPLGGQSMSGGRRHT